MVNNSLYLSFDVLIYADKDKKKNFNFEDQFFFEKMEMLNKILSL